MATVILSWRCQLTKTGVGVEKVTSISRMKVSRSMLEGSDPAHALFDSHSRRPADHDGTTRPYRSAVLLLPPGRSSSRDHLLRLIEKHISFAFVRERLKDSYSETDRPSIDPELLLRILLMSATCMASPVSGNWWRN